MKMNKPNFPLYLVIWKDHIGDSSWKSIEEITKEKYVLAYSIGYLIHKDKDDNPYDMVWYMIWYGMVREY